MWLLWRGIISSVCGSRLPTFLHEPFYHKQIPVLTHSFQQNQPTAVSQTWMSLAFNKLLAHQTVLITTGKQYKYHILYYTCKIDSFPFELLCQKNCSLCIDFKGIILAAKLQINRLIHVSVSCSLADAIFTYHLFGLGNSFVQIEF